MLAGLDSKAVDRAIVARRKLLSTVLTLTLAALLAPGGGRDPSVAEAGRDSRREARQAASKIRRCAHAERAKHGLPAVRGSHTLNKASVYHARNMAKHRFFDHRDPWGRQSWDRVALFDSRPWLPYENIGAGYRTVRAACRGWMTSSGHRDNILEPSHQYVGGGFARGRSGYRTYYVLVLGRMYDPAVEGTYEWPE